MPPWEKYKSKPWEKRQPQQPTAPPMLDQAMDAAGRQIGLTGRYLAQGATAIPMMFGDAANAAINLGVIGTNTALGTDIPELEYPSQVQKEAFDEVFPVPEGLEKIAEVGGSALSGAGLATIPANIMKNVGLTAFKKLPTTYANPAKYTAAAPIPVKSTTATDLVPRYTKEATEFFADAPVLQTIGGLAGAGATQAAIEAGVEDPAALAGIGILGSTLGGGSATTIPRVGTTAKSVIDPLRRKGQEVIAGRALKRFATDAEAAIPRLKAAEEFVPDSVPMTPGSSRDPGLSALETPMRGIDVDNRIGQRKSAQNTARQNLLETIAGDESTKEAAKAIRKSTFKELAEPAFEEGGSIDWGDTRLTRATELNPIFKEIEEIRATPEGKRDVVRKAMQEVENLLTEADVDYTDPASLYAKRKDIILARDGKLSGDKSELKYAKGELQKVITKIDETIEKAAPGFRDYLSTHTKRSVALDQITALQSFRNRLGLSVPDPVTGLPVLSNNFGKILTNNLDNGLGLRGLLDDDQLSILNSIAADIDRGAASQASTVRAPGSETFRNQSVANVLGRMLGDDLGALAGEGSLIKNMSRPLNFLYRVPDDDIQVLIIDAILDPKLAARLMEQASKTSLKNIAVELKNKVAIMNQASALYNQGQPE